MTRKSIRDKVLDELALLEQNAATLSDASLPAFDELVEAATDQALDPDTRIGHWKIRDQIGQGGMARVYRVQRTDGLLDQQLALKIMSDRFDSESTTSRFMREQQILANLNHQHIARFLDAGVTSDAQPWFVMEYIPGPDLLTHCVTESLPLKDRIRLFRQVCEALAHAHAHGIVHRDIKPSNILVDTEQRQVKLLDFGVAAQQSSEGLTLTGTIMGTPGYMSPEQASGKSVIDERSDLFAMGILLYQLINERLPFPGDSLPEVSYRVVHQPPDSCDASVPPDLEAIIGQCLEKKPGHRYASVNLLLNDIDAFLQGKPVQARRIGRLQRLLRWSQRNRAISAAVLIALLALVFAGSYASLQSYRALQSIQASETMAYQSQKLVNEVRRIHMMPAHDVQPDYDRVRDQLGRLRQDMATNPLINPGQGHAAIGAVHLALAEHDLAKEALEAAQVHGWQTPQSTYDYGRAMLSIWQVERLSLRQISDAEAREARSDELDNSYREPAITALKSVRGSVDQSDFLDAQLALFEGDYSQAIEHAERSLTRNDWHYESHLLIAEALMRRLTVEGRKTGYVDSLPDIHRSMIHNQAALQIGRSDPMVSVSICADYSTQAQVFRLLGNTEDLAASIDDSVSACETAINLYPESNSAYLNLSEILIAQADLLGEETAEALTLYEQALTTFREGLLAQPNNLRLRLGLVKVLVRIADNHQEHERPQALELYDEARQIAQRLAENDADNYLSWTELARVTLSMANYQRDHTQAYPVAAELYYNAIAHYAQAHTLSGSFAASLNGAFTWSELAENQVFQGMPDDALTAAGQSVSTFIEHLDPDKVSHLRYWVSALGISLQATDWAQEASLDSSAFDQHSTEITTLICSLLISDGARDEGFDALIKEQTQAGHADRLTASPCMKTYRESPTDA